MIEVVSEEAWLKLEELLPEKWCEHREDERYYPDTLPYQGYLEGSSGVTPPNDFLQCLQAWLLRRGEKKVFYFLLESAEGDEINFQASIDDLNYDSLSAVNRFGENIIAAQDYSWLLYMHHEGYIYIAGPDELSVVLRDCWNQLD